MLTALYNRVLKQKYFNRLLLTYTLIILLTICILSIAIIRNMNQSAEKDAVNSTNQTVQIVKNYFDQKENTLKLLLQQLYLNPNQSQDMLEFLTQEISSYTNDEYAKANLIQYYLDSAAFQDKDILDNSIYKKISGNLYVHSNDYPLNIDDYIATNKPLFSKLNDEFHGLSITPSYLQTYGTSNQKRIFTIAANIRGGNLATSFNRSIAILSVNFNTDRINDFIKSQMDPNYLNQILVLNKEGQIITDTMNLYYDKIYPYLDKVTKTDNQVMLNENSIVSTAVNDNLGYYIVSILPHSEIASKTQAARNTVISIATISALFAILLGFFSIRFFSKRIKFINKAIQKVQTNDFTYRIPVNTINDEIDSIAVNFNQMCDWIINYIEKVYLSELKQKDAELYALQSQIDPHFLYNTLEVIRMEALASGNGQVSQMIEILAQLFRSSIKGDMYVHIKEELNFCKNYLELYNIRYAEILTFEFQIDPAILEFGIMKHLLQPIVENSVIHGIKHTRPDNQIIVKGYLLNDDVIIEIIDNGQGMDIEQQDRLQKQLNIKQIHSHTSIGIYNVNQRIQLAFGKEYGVKMTSKKGEGTTISLKIPAITKGELLKNVQSIDRG